MHLRLIERGTRLQIILNPENSDNREEFEGSFFDVLDLVSETSIIVQCSKLSRKLDAADRNAPLEISFCVGANVHTFTGRAIGKKYGDMVVIEKTGDIVTLNRRIYERDELHIDVRVYKLSEDKLEEHIYTPPDEDPAMTEVCFDISAGGMCIITNITLRPENHDYFLLDFFIGLKERFLLPSVLVRRSNYSRTAIGKHDYGFKFIFDHMPSEKGRLTKAIISRKLSRLR